MKYSQIIILLLWNISIASTSFAQTQNISIDSLRLKGKTLLFKKYEAVGKHCTDKNDQAKHCQKAYRLFDNNIESLSQSFEESLAYLKTDFKIIDSASISKKNYEDLEQFPYFFVYQPTTTPNWNSCFANPANLLIRFDVIDRKTNERYAVDLKYPFYICDVLLLVNHINKSIENTEE